MSNAAPIPSEFAMTRIALKLHNPLKEMASPTRWLINGFPATILTWTPEEWVCLAEQPADAQEGPNGIRCLLRME